MATKKITDLTELSAADAASADVLPIVDIDADVTKKITLTSIKSGSFSGSFQGYGGNLTGLGSSFTAAGISGSWQGATGSMSVLSATTASYVLNAVSASYAASASYEITKEVSSSYADVAGGLTGQPSISVTSLTVSGSINLTGSINITGSTINNIGPFNQTGLSTFTGDITATGDISSSGGIYVSGSGDSGGFTLSDTGYGLDIADGGGNSIPETNIYTSLLYGMDRIEVEQSVTASKGFMTELNGSYRGDTYYIGSNARLYYTGTGMSIQGEDGGAMTTLQLKADLVNGPGRAEFGEITSSAGIYIGPGSVGINSVGNISSSGGNLYGENVYSNNYFAPVLSTSKAFISSTSDIIAIGGGGTQDTIKFKPSGSVGKYIVMDAERNLYYDHGGYGDYYNYMLSGSGDIVARGSVSASMIKAIPLTPAASDTYSIRSSGSQEHYLRFNEGGSQIDQDFTIKTYIVDGEGINEPELNVFRVIGENNGATPTIHLGPNSSYSGSHNTYVYGNLNMQHAAVVGDLVPAASGRLGNANHDTLLGTNGPWNSLYVQEITASSDISASGGLLALNITSSAGFKGTIDTAAQAKITTLAGATSIGQALQVTNFPGIMTVDQGITANNNGVTVTGGGIHYDGIVSAAATDAAFYSVNGSRGEVRSQLQAGVAVDTGWTLELRNTSIEADSLIATNVIGGDGAIITGSVVTSNVVSAKTASMNFWNIGAAIADDAKFTASFAIF